MRNNVFVDMHYVFYQLTFKAKCPFIVGASVALVKTDFCCKRMLILSRYWQIFGIAA